MFQSARSKLRSELTRLAAGQWDETLAAATWRMLNRINVRIARIEAALQTG
jgi:hypothetical protein